MQAQILDLIDQFTAEADQVAQELRSFMPRSNPGRHLELSHRYGDLLRWIETCRGHLA